MTRPLFRHGEGAQAKASVTSGIQTIPKSAPKGPRHDGEKLCHIGEYADPDKALCGKDVTGYPWDPPWPMCVVCVDLYDQGFGQ